MKKPSKATLRSQAYDDANIARAIRYSVFLRNSPKEKFIEPAYTVEEAKAKARAMALLGAYGRRPIIYAITPEGWTVPLRAEDQIR